MTSATDSRIKTVRMRCVCCGLPIVGLGGLVCLAVGSGDEDSSECSESSDVSV